MSKKDTEELLQHRKDLLDRISYDTLYEYFILKNNSITDTLQYFSISDTDFRFLKNTYNIKKDKKAASQVAKKNCLQKYSVENPAQLDSIKAKIRQTNLDRYGVEYPAQNTDIFEKRSATMLEKYGAKFSGQSDIILDKMKQTNINRYGTEYAVQSNVVREKIKQTNISKYGVDNPMQMVDFKDKSKITMLNKYGVDNPSKSITILEKRKQTCTEKYGVEEILQKQEFRNVQKMHETMLSKYGVKFAAQSTAIHDKMINTCLSNYGVPYYCMTLDCVKNNCNDSKPNKIFKQKLLDNNILNFEREFPVENNVYDFKINNILVEINPFATHNSTWGIFGNPKPIDYHLQKLHIANNNNFNCINIWDWDDQDKIISLLTEKEKVFARKCIVRIVGIAEETKFLNTYHLQNYIKSKVAIGLYYNNELVSIMTFGNPRYNKHYKWELLRYCSSKNVIGGAERLFKYFINNYNPASVVSYCDLSKFSGNVYKKLGFSLFTTKIKPSKHWYNPKTCRHITDNLLRQRGFDQLLGNEYGKFGKGSSNKELMLQHNFVEIYDCGQATYIWNAEAKMAASKSDDEQPTRQRLAEDNTENIF